MTEIKLFFNYLSWHYTLAVRDIIFIWRDFFWFLWNYFSIRQLIKTFFVPWKRLGEDAVNFFDFFNFFSAIVVTLIMRIFGILVRSAVIAVGLLSLVLSLLFGVLFFSIWIFAPLIILISFMVSLRLFLM